MSKLYAFASMVVNARESMVLSKADENAFVSYDVYGDDQKEESDRPGVNGPSEQEIVGGSPEGNRQQGRKGPMGSVYFLESEDRKLVKIGWTSRLMIRFQQLRDQARGFGRDLRLVGFFPARRTAETILHQKFREYSVFGDWYDPAVLEAFADCDGLPFPSLVKRTAPRLLPNEQRHTLDYFRKQGRKGGLLGGKIRAGRLTKAERQAIARKAAEARWAKVKKDA